MGLSMKSRRQMLPSRFVPRALQRTGRMRFISPLLWAACLAFTPGTAAAQDMMSGEMQQLQEKSNFDRNLVVTNAMQLTDVEGPKFWPVYMSYLNDLQNLNRIYAQIIQNYVFARRTQALSDDLAQQLTDQFLATQEKELALRKTYAANLAKVLPGVTAARAVQLENKIRAVAWYGLSSQLPLARQ